MSKKRSSDIPQKKEENQTLITRRELLKTASLAGAGIAAGGILSSCASGEGGEQTISWVEEVDVIVIGSGFAGIAAAMEAKKAGSSVLVIEKMRVLGGNSVINGGVMAVPNNDLQDQQGIQDSKELFIEDMLKAGRGLNHRNLVSIIAEQAKSAYEFAVEAGAEFSDSMRWMGGHSVARSYFTSNGSGAGILLPMIEKAEQAGVDIRKQVKMLQFILGPDQRVQGLKVKENYRFGEADSGNEKYIKAKKAIIIASGGFSQDMGFRTSQDPRLTDAVDSTNHKGATAEVILESLKLGTVPIQVSWIQLGPWTSPDEEGFGQAPHFSQLASLRYGVLVGQNTGKRFVNEMGDRKERADAMLQFIDENDNPVYPISIADSVGVQAAPNFPHVVDIGLVKEFETLQGLADHYGIPYEPLKQTVDQYNSYIDQGLEKDPDFGKPLNGCKKLNNPPFYGIKLWPKVHHTMGGIQINEKAQVLKVETQEKINGLYAAGEAAGGVHGASRLGSCATTDCIVFGRIAGQNAAAEQPWG